MRVPGRLFAALAFASVILPWRTLQGHSSDVLLARLSFGSDSTVALEVTADLTGSAWLRDSRNPAEVLGRMICVGLPGGRFWALGDLGKPSVSLHSGFPHWAPISLVHGEGETPPEFYSVTWSWRPSDTPLRFEVVKGSPATLVFWTVQPGGDGPSSAWEMLSEGEKSREVDLPFKPVPLLWNWKAYVAMSVAASGLLMQAILILRRLRRLRRA